MKIESWKTFRRWNVADMGNRTVEEVLESHGFALEGILDLADDSYHKGQVEEYMTMCTDLSHVVYRVGNGIFVYAK